MLVTSADLWAPDPGTVVSWRVEPGTASPQPVELSLNQRNHLAAAVEGEPSVWLAATFDVDGPIDAQALEDAYRTVVARHSALQCGADVVGGQVRGVRHDASALRWTRLHDAQTSSVDGTRDLVGLALDRACSPLTFPAFWPAAISRPGRSTVVFGLDHLHADAYSLVVLVDDLHTLYDAAVGGRPRPVLEEASCFVSGLAEPQRRVSAHDDRLAAWHEFLDDHDHRLPTFPLPLGVEPGQRLAQHTHVTPLADAGLAELVGEHARRHGGTTGSAVLTALAAAVADLGGPERLAMLMPVHTRATERDRRAVGWYTATVPVELPTADDPCTALSSGAQAVAASRAMAAVPLDQVLETAAHPLVRERVDVFMASYLDYRRLPGHGELERRRAHHVSAPTVADDLQAWVSRTDAGLAARVRVPLTPTAVQVVSQLTARWADRIAGLAPCRCAEQVGVTACSSGPPEHRRPAP